MRPDCIDSLRPVVDPWDGDAVSYGRAKQALATKRRAQTTFEPVDRSDDGYVSLYYAENFFGRALTQRLLSEASCGPLGLISHVDFWMMCLASINLTDDEGHGCTAQRLPKLSGSMVWSSVNEMETLGGGLRRFVELLRIVPWGISASLGYSAQAARLTLTVHPSVADVERGERYIELITLVFNCILRWGANRDIEPLALRLSSTLNPCDGSIAASLCNRRTRLGTGLAITYRREDLAIPLGSRRYQRWASAETSAFLEMIRRAPAVSATTATFAADDLRLMLAQANMSQQKAAQKLGMSVATLQRRLAETGDSFREISRETRTKKLSSLLATDSNLDDIAVELGFSERRSLWRACHDWFGMSPASYRRLHS